MTDRIIAPIASRRGIRPFAVAALETLLFITVAVWATWPLATQLATCLPLGSEREPTVPLFNLWTLWWNVDRIDHGYADYWRAPIFFPAPDAFAYSEPQSLSGQAAWILWRVLRSPECVYNVLLLGHLALNGSSFYWLLRAWRIGWPTALSAGLMVECLPMVHWQLGVVQLVPLWGIIWTIRFLERFTRLPSAASCFGLGFFAAATYLLCSYYGLMLSVLLLVTSPLLFTRCMLRVRAGLLTASALALALVCILPVAGVQWRTTQRHDMVPPRELIKQLSVGPQHYFQTPWPQLLAPPGLPRLTLESPWALSPGTLKLVFAGVGIWCGLAQKKQRRITVFSLAVIVAAVLLAMGPTLELGGWSIYHWLSYYPGYAQLRNIYRFAIFAQLMTIVLAAVGLDTLWRRLRTLVRKRFARRRTGKAILWVGWSTTAALLLVEVTPAAPRLHCLGGAPAPRWVSWLRDESSQENVLAMFPFPADETLREYEPTTTGMYWQIQHARRMINGYSGFFPPEVVERESRMRGFPDRLTLEELAQVGVDLLLVRGPLNAKLQHTLDSQSFAFSVERSLWDSDSHVGIYRIRRR